MRVYLAGPIHGRDDEAARGWRREVAAELALAGIGVIDPMERDYRGREQEPGVARELMDDDKADILRSDVVLVNAATEPSWGTAMEILWAFGVGKPVYIALGLDAAPPSPWLTRHATRVGQRPVLEMARLLRDLEL